MDNQLISDLAADRYGNELECEVYCAITGEHEFKFNKNGWRVRPKSGGHWVSAPDILRNPSCAIALLQETFADCVWRAESIGRETVFTFRKTLEANQDFEGVHRKLSYAVLIAILFALEDTPNDQ